jgi:hypothetical protein
VLEILKCLKILKITQNSEQILKIAENSEQILRILKIAEISENYFVTVSSHRSATSYKNVLSSRDRLSLFGRSVNS